MDTTRTDRLDQRINRLGASLFFHPATVDHAAGCGIDNVFVLYGGGRAGVMGDVGAEQVVSAFCFFEPSVVHDVWTGVTAAGGAVHLADVWIAGMAAAASAWDRAAAADVVRIGRRVLDATPPIGTALYAGWRARVTAFVPASEPTVAATEPVLVVHALRELRGDIHVQSIAAGGLHPLDAEMVTRGAAAAQLHGWKPPYPDPDTARDRVLAAEASTATRMARIYGTCLDDAALDELDRAVAVLAGPEAQDDQA